MRSAVPVAVFGVSGRSHGLCVDRGDRVLHHAAVSDQEERCPMQLLDLHSEVVVMVLLQIERLKDLARMDRVSHAFHSPPACMPTLLQRPPPLIQQALRLRAEAGAFADLAKEVCWAHLPAAGQHGNEEVAEMIRQAARACALREQHGTAAEMLMLAAYRCPVAESAALVRGVLRRSGYRPRAAGRAAHLTEMQAFCAMSILLGSG